MFDEDRFQILLEAYFDESLEGAEREEFERLICANAAARTRFWSAARQHAAAREWALNHLGTEAAAATPRAGNRQRPVILAAAGGLAAVGVVWVGAALWPAAPPAAPAVPVVETLPPAAADEAGPVALLAVSTGTRWEKDGPRQGSALPPGRLALEEGVIRIDSYSGARIWLRGPGAVELLDPLRVRLLEGAVRVEMTPAARGFSLIAESSEISGRGGAYGVEIAPGGGTEVHALAGSVEVESHGQTRVVEGGRGVASAAGGWQEIAVNRTAFPDSVGIGRALAEEQRRRFELWRREAAAFSRGEGTLVHYPFSEPIGDSGHVVNAVPGRGGVTDGRLIGGRRSEGRWPGKPGLALNGHSDRIRLVLPGTYPSTTYLAWVLFDRLPVQMGALWRTEDIGPGAVHWNVDSAGRLRLGVFTGDPVFKIPDQSQPTPWDVAWSEPVLGGSRGQWTHLAATYDSVAREMRLYLDGEEIKRHVTKHSLPVKMGVAQIGSSIRGEPFSGLPDHGSLDCLIDEFAVVGRAMSGDEIRFQFVNGRPAAVEKPQ